ncbi:glutaredoxin family protein [candidate division KSB1 bacterium]
MKKDNIEMPEVTFYTKEGCSLCLKAKEVINKVSKIVKFQYTEIDITEDDTIYKKFIEQIPVVFINGRKSFKFYVNEKKMMEKLLKCG